MHFKEIQLKEGAVEDLNNIASLHAKSWQENYHEVLSADYLKGNVFAERLAVWAERLKSPKSNQKVIVAIVDGEFAGFICIFGANSEKYGTIIDNLHVTLKFKGCGVGTKLLRAAAEWANEYNEDLPLYLEVLACNAKAIAFYSSLGGVHIATAYWQTPCNNQTEEHIYSWSSAKALIP